MIGTITLLGREVSSYGLCVGVAALAVLMVLPRLAEERGMGAYVVSEAGLLCAPLAIVGASLLYALTKIDVLRQLVMAVSSASLNFEAAWPVVVACFGGMVFYGGLIGSLCGLALWVRLHGRERAADAYDLFAVGLPLFHAIARVGCFLGGCCYGIEFHPGLVLAASPVPGAADVERLPVQLIEALVEATLFVAILRLYRRHEMRGELLWVWIGAYAPLRFLIEFLRGDDYRGFWGPLSTSQWVSALLLVCLAWHLLSIRKGSRAAA